MTLDELKAENAALEQPEAEEAPQAEPVEIEESEAVEDDMEELSIDAGQEDDETKEPETEAWMQSDEEEDQPQTVPVAAHAKVRSKLKAKIAEGNEEIEKLKAEIQAMKAQPQQQSAPVGRPKLEDFYEQDNPEEAFTDALVDWKLNNQIKTQSEQQKKDEQERLQREAAQRIEKEVDNHYERAAKLSQISGIKPEAFQASDLKVKQAVEKIAPNMGELIVNNLISNLGEGSEKVMHHIGINNAAMNEFKSALIDDPSGLRAMAFLGAKKAQLTQPKKRYSQAPKPAAQLNGNESTPASDKDFKRQYNAAVKSGDMQKRMDIRRAAKAAGHDPKTW